MADSIGKCKYFISDTHPSISEIKENKKEEKAFNFYYIHIDENKVSKLIDKLQIKKATGVDKLSSKIIRFGKPALGSPLADLINLTIPTSTFPEYLKRKQLDPLHNKVIQWKNLIFDQSVCLQQPRNRMRKSFQNNLVYTLMTYLTNICMCF